MKLPQLLQLFALAALWGASFLFIRLAVPHFGVVPLTAVRSVVATITLMPILLLNGKWPELRSHWPHILVIGLISTAIPATMLSVSTKYTSAGFASILNALTPLFSALVAWLWLKEALTLPVVAGITLGFIGVLVMVFDREILTTGFVLLPIVAGVTGTLLYGLTGNYSRRFAQSVSPIVIAAGCQLFSALFMVPLSLFLWPSASVPVEGWIYGAILGVFCTGVAFILYFQLLEKVGVVRTVVVTYLVPVFGMLWGLLFLSETITLRMLIGAALILAGVGLSTKLAGLKS